MTIEESKKNVKRVAEFRGRGGRKGLSTSPLLFALRFIVLLVISR